MLPIFLTFGNHISGVINLVSNSLIFIKLSTTTTSLYLPKRIGQWRHLWWVAARAVLRVVARAVVVASADIASPVVASWGGCDGG